MSATAGHHQAHDMAMPITPEIKKQMDEIRSYFPTEQALLLPLLHAIQKTYGWISRTGLRNAAEYLKLPLARVVETVTFYTMYNLQPVGKRHVQICTNISCWLNGADRLLNCMEKRLGISAHQSTADGKYTLNEVECLGSCGTAPVMQVNDDYYEGLTEDGINKLFDGWERG